MRFARVALGVLGLLYGLVILVAWAGQRHLVYNPDPRKTSPAAAGLDGVEERWVEAADGVRVVA